MSERTIKRAVYQVLSEIINGINNDQCTVVIFMHFKKGFDCVERITVAQIVLAPRLKFESNVSSRAAKGKFSLSTRPAPEKRA